MLTVLENRSIQFNYQVSFNQNNLNDMLWPQFTRISGKLLLLTTSASFFVKSVDLYKHQVGATPPCIKDQERKSYKCLLSHRQLELKKSAGEVQTVAGVSL